MTVNGNGVASTTGRQLLQIIPINIITVITMVVCSVGLYYKFDARIAALEKANNNTEIRDKVNAIERQQQADTQRIIRTDTNVLWMMSKQVGAPKE